LLWFILKYMHRQQVAVSGVVFNSDNQVLVVRRSKDDDFLPGAWEFPGGGTEYGESPQVGLIREIEEECRLVITVGKPITTGTYYMDAVQRVEIVFACFSTQPVPKVVLSREHDAFAWVSLSEIAALDMTPYMMKLVKEVILAYD